jgi:hypothetical protein
MKGDFTRLTFEAKRQYSSVRMQQGRVLLDADWNEEHDIVAHRIETETVDVIGKCGAPLHDAGFHVVTSTAALTPDEQALPANANPPAGPLLISAGRYYVDGLLIENERIVSITDQPDLPPPGTAPLVTLGSGEVVQFPPPAGTYIVYLDVWQRHITALEDQSLREQALGGPDTATRTHTVWQVRLLQADAGTSCTTKSEAWDALIAEPTGTLEARTVEPEVAANPCDITAGGGYRRLENQLYRVEVHDSGALDTATFKWSRDNGSIVTSWLGNGANANELKVASVGPDEVLRFAPEQWVELTDDEHELQGRPGVLVQLANAQNDILTILPGTAIPAGPISFAAFGTHPKVRRWEADSGGEALRTIEVVAGNDGFLELEDGVEVKFSAGTYRSGDYWLIPARTASGDIEWPAHQPLPPHGIQHHYCRIAVADVTAQAINVSDCRSIFPPLTELPEGGDLRRHNKYLHGWGVVCGLQVHCGGEVRQTVAVEKGYAIACDGTDIWVGARQSFPIVEAAAAANLLDATGNGTACITLKPAGEETFSLGVSADPDAGQSFWQRVLEGTLLKDVYDDCLKPLLDVLRKLAAADGPNAKLPLSDAHRNQVAAINLLAQLANQSSGTRVFLSVDEHKRLVKLYSALVGELKSQTFCGIRDGIRELPNYPFAASGLDTFYGKTAHRTLRPDATGQRVYAFGGDTPVFHAFNMASGEIDIEVRLDDQTLAICDVLRVGKRALVAAANADKTILFSYDAATFKEIAAPVEIPGARVMRLLSFGTDPEDVAFAIVRGVGLVSFSPSKPATLDSQKAIVPFNATGHLSTPHIGARGIVDLLAGAATPGAAPDRYSQLIGIRILGDKAQPGVTIPLVDANNQTVSGQDAIEFSPATAVTGALSTIQAIVDSGDNKTLVVIRGDNAPRFIPLGAVGAVSLAAVPEFAVTAMTLENEYYLTWVNPDSDRIDEFDRLPLQVGPTCVVVARNADGAARMLVALNRGSHTLTVAPLDYLAGQRRFDMAALAAYRAQMLAAWRDLLLRLAQRVKDCICEHLLLDCPTCGENDILILACVDIRNRQVHSICNFHRSEVVTFRKLFYWLSAVPIIPLVREAVAELCCLILPDLFRPRENVAGDFVSPKTLNSSALRLRELDFTDMQQSIAGYFRMIGNLGIESLFGRPDRSKAVSARVGSSAVLNRNATAVKRSLTDAGVVVNAVHTIGPDRTHADLPRLASIPLAVSAGDRVDLYTDNGKVVYYTRAAPPEAPALDLGMRAAAQPADLQSTADALRQEFAARELVSAQQIAEHAREIESLKTELAQLRGARRLAKPAAKARATKSKKPR